MEWFINHKEWGYDHQVLDSIDIGVSKIMGNSRSSSKSWVFWAQTWLLWLQHTFGSNSMNVCCLCWAGRAGRASATHPVRCSSLDWTSTASMSPTVRPPRSFHRRCKRGWGWFHRHVKLPEGKQHVFYITHLAERQNLVPLVNIKKAGKWMCIPLKMVLIGIDP
jgi:hypothetical protein